MTLIWWMTFVHSSADNQIEDDPLEDLDSGKKTQLRLIGREDSHNASASPSQRFRFLVLALRRRGALGL